MFLVNGVWEKMDINKELGVLLKKKREELGLSLSNVGAKMHKNKSTIYYYENGRISIDVLTLDRLCHVYGTDMYSLFDELKELSNGTKI